MTQLYDGHETAGLVAAAARAQIAYAAILAINVRPPLPPLPAVEIPPAPAQDGYGLSAEVSCGYPSVMLRTPSARGSVARDILAALTPDKLADLTKRAWAWAIELERIRACRAAAVQAAVETARVQYAADLAVLAALKGGAS